MYHTAAYTALLGTTADTDIAALTDDVLSIRSNHFVFAEETQLVWASAQSATLNRARLSQPSFLPITRPFIRPIEQAAIPSDLFPFANYTREPFRLRVNEELAVEATSDIAMGTERFTALVGLIISPPPLPAGNIFTWRGTAAATLVANAWTNLGEITFDNQLQTGVYAVVGATFFSANCIAGRLLFPGSASKWRPGAPGITDLGNQVWPTFEKGGLGFEWGRFDAFALPQVEMLANAADTAETVYLDLVKVA